MVVLLTATVVPTETASNASGDRATGAGSTAGAHAAPQVTTAATAANAHRSEVVMPADGEQPARQTRSASALARGARARQRAHVTSHGASFSGRCAHSQRVALRAHRADAVLPRPARLA